MTYSLGCCRQSAISDFKERTLNNSGFSAEGTLISSSTLPSRGKDSGIRDQVPEKTSPHVLLEAQDQRLGAEQDQLPCGPAGTSSGNCQETETCLVRARHTPRQPLQTEPSSIFSRGDELIMTCVVDWACDLSASSGSYM